ncbi:hypothetical protein SLS56_005835 [Neofusicoccum ribis]|uniref:Major facilitator superfamily (MFS) profile domain-containing protein n=1 Tax=Neofusicoccum ribis TaxID=45134 RepID=A0ABR3SSK2_9PEZI
MSSAENKNTTEHRPSAGMTSPQVSDTSLNVKHPQFMGMRGKKLSLVVSIIATTGFLLFGYDQGVMSGIIAAEPFNDYFPETKGNKTYQGFVTAIYEVGCLFGAILMLTCGDQLGRRKGIMIGGAIMIVGVIIQISSVKGSNATAQFIIGRTITGIGNGMNTSTIPTYQAECSKSTNRGLLICIEGGIIAFGTMIAYWIDYGCSYGSENLSWRFPIAFQVVFGLVLCLFMIGLPESPRWLMTKDRHEEALKVIAALRGLSVDDDETKLQAAIIMDGIRASGHAGGNTSYRDLLTGGKTQHCRRMLIGASSQLFQQIGGCNAVIYYFPILFEDTIGESTDLSLLLGGVNMIVYSIFATTSWFLIERTGRRKLFLIGTVGQCLSMVIVFACLIPGNPQDAKGAALNPLKTRAKANAVSTITNWLFNFLIVMVTPVMIDNIGWGTYLFFAAVNACFFPVIYFFYPETRMRSLEEIDLIFAKGYLENTSYVTAAKNLPFLSDDEIDAKAKEYGFVSDEEGVERDSTEKATHTEKETESGGSHLV